MELDDKNIDTALSELIIHRLKLDIAIQSLQEIRGEIKPKKLDLKVEISEIANFCIGHFGVDLREKIRSQDHIWSRCFYFKLAKTYTRSSLEKIGNEVNLNHATVINGLKRHQDMEDYKDADYLRFIDKAEECFTTHLLTLSNKTNEDEN
tara:strand:+ start:5712 stop:6161 length:450 start_codon:yes stop_codon:yes gene_type:complete